MALSGTWKLRAVLGCLFSLLLSTQNRGEETVFGNTWDVMPSKFQVTQGSGGEKRGAVSQSRKPASQARFVGVLRYTFEFH